MKMYLADLILILKEVGWLLIQALLIFPFSQTMMIVNLKILQIRNLEEEL